MLPARVGDDDLVGHGLQAVVDDHHLQGLVGGQVPQSSWVVRGERGRQIESREREREREKERERDIVKESESHKSVL